MDKNFEQANIFGIGQENSGYEQYFSGASFLNPLTDPAQTMFLQMSLLNPVAVKCTKILSVYRVYSV